MTKKVTRKMLANKLGQVLLDAYDSMREFDKQGAKFMGKKYKRQFTNPDGTVKKRYL